MADQDSILRWSIHTLVEHVPGSSRAFWRRMLPTLISRGVLVKSGHGWLGRRAALDAALLEQTDEFRPARSYREHSRQPAMSSATDLNSIYPVDDAGQPVHDAPLIVERTCALTAHFDGLRDRLVDLIVSAHFVVGCVAWLSDEVVLAALARLPIGCQVVVQKEDFLRPDGRARGKVLRAGYEKLRCLDRIALPFGASELSQLGSQECGSVRCVGVAGGAFRPLMHHKFLVFLDGEFAPYATWTGSFNMSATAIRSRENAVVIRDRAVAETYGHEWCRMLAISEALDWQHRYVRPDWRFGS
jgi:hypothetical protein